MLLKFLKRIITNGKGEQIQKIETEAREDVSRVFCNDKKLEDFILKWSNSSKCVVHKNENWKFEDFEIVIKMLGYQTPLKVSKFDQNNQTFECTQLDESGEPKSQPVVIELVSATDSNHRSISITDGNTKNSYEIADKYANSQNIRHIINTNSVTKSENRKEVNVQYEINSVTMTVNIDTTHELVIELRPIPRVDWRDLYKYLLKVTRPIVASEVFTKVVNGLNKGYQGTIRIEFNQLIIPENADNLKEAELSAKTQRKPIFIMRVLDYRGEHESKKYVSYKNGEAFCVSGDGSWSYSSEKVKIIYNTENFGIDVVGNKIEDITNVNDITNMERITEKINSIMKYVK